MPQQSEHLTEKIDIFSSFSMVIIIHKYTETIFKIRIYFLPFKNTDLQIYHHQTLSLRKNTI
jgi:hypothetical protein